MSEPEGTPPPRYDDLYPDRGAEGDAGDDAGGVGGAETAQRKLRLVTEKAVTGCVTCVKLDWQLHRPEVVYVQTNRQPSVRQFTLAGETLASFGTGSGGLMVAPDPEGGGGTCVCVAEGGTISRTNPDGSPLAVAFHRHLPVDGDHDIVSMATLHKDGRVKYAVVDLCAHSVLVIEPFEGVLKRTFKVTKGDRFEPRHVASNQALKDTLAVSGLHSNQVRLYSRKGEMIDIMGCYGNGDDAITEPEGVAIDDLGRVLVCDHGNGRVVQFSRAADTKGWRGECLLSSAALGDRRPCHVDVSPSGHVVVSVQSKFGEFSWLLFEGYS